MAVTGIQLRIIPDSTCWSWKSRWIIENICSSAKVLLFRCEHIIILVFACHHLEQNSEKSRTPVRHIDYISRLSQLLMGNTNCTMGGVIAITFSGVVFVLARDLRTAGFVVPVSLNRRLPPWASPSSSIDREKAKPRVYCSYCRNAADGTAWAHASPSLRRDDDSTKQRARCPRRSITTARYSTTDPISASEEPAANDDRIHGEKSSRKGSTSAVVVATGEEDIELNRLHDHDGAGSTTVPNVFDHELEQSASPKAKSAVDSLESNIAETEGAIQLERSSPCQIQPVWESGVPWSEFEDWLLQDTFSR